MSLSLKLDLHIHSDKSPDGVTSVSRIVEGIRDRDLDGFSITDHNYFDPDRYQTLSEETDLVVVPGEEINTNQGHVLAYFIEEEIEPFREAVDVVEDIHAQDGIAVMAHPFRLRQNYSEGYHELFDGIELFNSRSGDPSNTTSPNFYTKTMVEHHGITAITGGSDSHLPWTVGNGITELPTGPNLKEIKKAILEGEAKAYGRASYQFNRAISKAVFLARNPDPRDWANYFSDAAEWLGRDFRSMLGF